MSVSAVYERRARLGNPMPPRIPVVIPRWIPLPPKRASEPEKIILIDQPQKLPDAGTWLPSAMTSPPVNIYLMSAEMLKQTCLAFGISKEEILSHRRTAYTVWARQVCMWLMKTHTTLSYPSIGRRMGGKDHTSVLAAVRRVESAIKIKGHNVGGDWETALAALRLVGPKQKLPAGDLQEGKGQ